MPGGSATDAIFVLRQTIGGAGGRGSIGVAFVDLGGHMRPCARGEIWRCSRERNVPEKYIRLVQDMYRGCKTVVRSAAGESNSFGVEVGLHQGSGSMMFADDIVLCGDDETDMAEYLETWRRALEDI